MQSISEFKNINLISSVVGQYIELQPAGQSRFKACCPFHTEKTPSFTVDDNKGRFKCYGCGRWGDHINFVMDMHGVDFKAAISILGISQAQQTPESKKAYRHKLKKIEAEKSLLESFRRWQVDYSSWLGDKIRSIHELMRSYDKIGDLDKYGEHVNRLETLEYHLEILSGNDDQLKADLFLEKL